MIAFFARTAFRNSRKEFFLTVASLFVAFLTFSIVDSLSSAVVSQAEKEARPALGADVVASSDSPISPESEAKVFELCKKYSAECSKRATFSSTLLDSSGNTALVRVVAAEPGYPYYGELRALPLGSDDSPKGVSRFGFAPDFPTASGFLADASVIRRFASGGLLPFFGTELRAQGAVEASPETAFSFGTDEAVVYVPYAAALAVPEIRTLSRANFSILVKTPDENIADAFAEELRQAFPDRGSLRVRSFRGGSGNVARIVSNVASYVAEAVSVTFLLAGTAAFYFSRAVWIANRRHFSVLRVLGASRFSVAAAFSAFFLAAAVLAAALAIPVAALALRFIPLPEGFGTVSFGIRECLRLFLVFPFVILPAAIPGSMAIFRSRPLDGFSEPKLVLPKPADALGAFASVFLAVWSFNLLVSGAEPVSAASKSAILVGGIGAVLALARFALPIASAAMSRFRSWGFALEDALRLSRAPGSPASAVVSAFLLPALLFASFSSLAFHFANELGRLSSTGYDAFAINLSRSDAEKVRAAYPVSEAYSLIRARISAISGQSLSERYSGDVPREFSREFNVTSSPLSEKILEGEARSPRIGEVSVDDEFSQNLGIGVGDVVTFSVMGREFPLSVLNVRESFREGTKPFFYFQVAPGEFDGLPASYFVSASPPDSTKFRSDVYAIAGSKASFVDVRQTVAMVRSVADRILPAVWAFLGAVGFLSVTVAVAVLSSLRTFRKARDRAYQAVGADRKFLSRQSRFSLLHYAAATFLAASVAAFPTVWWSIASVSFLKFSPSAAALAVATLFAFLSAACAIVWVAEG